MKKKKVGKSELTEENTDKKRARNWEKRELKKLYQQEVNRM